MNEIINKPWGSYQILSVDTHQQTKKIIIKPGQAPSYQYHHHRSEVWVITRGAGEYTFCDSPDSDYKNTTYITEGNVVEVGKCQPHQIKNIGMVDLEFIEIQRGEYFGEDDIVRISDIYGRE